MKSIDGYYFVYTLSYDGNVFYIGCCKDIVKRYAQHINKKDGAMAEYITGIKAKGHLPDLNIITFRPELESRSVEESLIKCISIGGHRLFNLVHYRPANKPICDKRKKDVYKMLAKEQEELKTTAQGYRGYYRPSIRKMDD